MPGKVGILPDNCNAIPLVEFVRQLGPVQMREQELAALGIYKVGTCLRKKTGKFYSPADLPRARAKLAALMCPQAVAAIKAMHGALKPIAATSAQAQQAIAEAEEFFTLSK